MPSTHYVENASLGQWLFGHAELGDVRRVERLVETFDAFLAHPQGTLPEKLDDPADLRGFYLLCNRPEVTHAAVLAPARQRTLERMAAQDGPVILVHDATELDYTSIKSLADDLGQIGTGGGRGYICQNVIAVAANSGRILGLVDQILHIRAKVDKQETLTEHRHRASRESLLWTRGTKHLPADWNFVDVSDQGSDTFEFLEHEVKSGRRFVVRAHKARKISLGHDPDQPRFPFQEAAAQLPKLGETTLDIQAQRGRKARKGAQLVVRGGAVLVHPPHAKHGHHGSNPLPMYLVQVEEVNPPKGQAPVIWRLFTNEPVHSLEDALRVIGWYETRWVVEEFHKGMKTGCGVEKMQFCTADALEPAIAVLSVTAAAILELRDAGRQSDAKERPATDVMPRDYVELLSVHRYKQRRDLTIHEFFMALGRLGGHQNRKGDGPPGWLVLWRGWIKLRSMLDGFDAAKQVAILPRRCGKT
jgi:hypothetical protein